MREQLDDLRNEAIARIERIAHGNAARGYATPRPTRSPFGRVRGNFVMGSVCQQSCHVCHGFCHLRALLCTASA
jgi:hypothetical protein